MIKRKIILLAVCAFGIFNSSCAAATGEANQAVGKPAETRNATTPAVSDNKNAAGAAVSEPRQAATVTVFDARTGIDKMLNAPAENGTPGEREFVKTEVKKHEKTLRAKVPFDCEADSTASIVGIVEGSFTKPNSKQKLYLYELCLTGREFGIGGLIVAENNQAVTHYGYGENGLYKGIFAVSDINQNGLTEIAALGFSVNQGYGNGGVDFFEMTGGNLNFLGRTEVYSSNEGAAANDAQTGITAYKISVQPATDPLFFRETYGQKQEGSKWTLRKKQEKFSLNKSEPPKWEKIY